MSGAEWQVSSFAISPLGEDFFTSVRFAAWTKSDFSGGSSGGGGAPAAFGHSAWAAALTAIHIPTCRRHRSVTVSLKVSKKKISIVVLLLFCEGAELGLMDNGLRK